MTKLYSYDHEGLTRFANNILGNVIIGLQKEGYLTQNECDEIGINYSVVVETTTWLPKWLSKWLKLEDDHLNFRLCKAIGRIPPNTEKNDETQ